MSQISNYHRLLLNYSIQIIESISATVLAFVRYDAPRDYRFHGGDN